MLFNPTHCLIKSNLFQKILFRCILEVLDLILAGSYNLLIIRTSFKTTAYPTTFSVQHYYYEKRH